MKIHPRTTIVQEAGVEIGEALMKSRMKYDLTDTEYLGILAAQMALTLRLCLRAERDSEDSSRPSDHSA